MKYFVTLLLINLSFSVFSKNSISFKDYKKGEGAQYDLKLAQGGSKVNVAVVESSHNKLVIETYFESTNEFMPIEMWQQFHLSYTNGKMNLDDGYVLMSQVSKKPQKLPRSYLQGYNNGVKMKDFLIGNDGSVPGQFIGKEKVSVKAGTVTASHFEYSKNGQTIHYWISKEAKPFGLVKIVSTGRKSDQNYTLELGSLLKNVSRKIHPSSSESLTDKGKSFLPSIGVDLFNSK